MRVLQINSVYGVGSTGRIMQNIHELLLRQGFESFVAYGREKGASDENNVIKIGNKLDVYRHVLLTRIFDKHGFGTKKATKLFLKKVEDIKPDIIHLHNIHGYYINIKLLFDFLKEYDKPVVWTFHDCWPFTGHCSYFDFSNCEKWKTGCYKCPEKRSYPASMFVDNSLNNYKLKKELFNSINDLTIVTPSKWLANLVKNSFLCKYPTKVIHNGIDLNIFKPTDSQFRLKYQIENKFIILGVANKWDRRKGLEYFIELSRLINQDEVIVLVGLTEKQKNKLPSNIIGLKRTDSIKELVQIYSTADVFVNPTLEDNFPTTNLEALACGTPVITFNTGGSIESIDEETGFIVKKGDMQMSLEKIYEIKYTGTKKYRNKCILRAKQMFNSLDRYQDYIKLYNNILFK